MFLTIFKLTKMLLISARKILLIFVTKIHNHLHNLNNDECLFIFTKLLEKFTIQSNNNNNNKNYEKTN